MKSLNAILVLGALGALTMLASPALAQKPYHHHRSQQHITSGAVDPSGRGIYNMARPPLVDNSAGYDRTTPFSGGGF
jgi:hypothetical protein